MEDFKSVHANFGTKGSSCTFCKTLVQANQNSTYA